MKFLTKTLALSLICIFTSCEKEDTSTTTTTSGNNNPNSTLSIKGVLPGNWNVDDVEQKDGKNFISGTSTMVSTFTGVGENVQGSMVFAEGPNTLTSSLGYDMKLDIKFQNPGLPNQTVTVPVPLVNSSGTWVFDADSSIVFTDANSMKSYYTVENKTANTLELSTPVNTIVTGQSSGFLLHIYLSK